MRESELESIDETSICEQDFTVGRLELFFNTVDGGDFFDSDVQRIFNSLHNRLKFIPFCDYLKRFVFERMELEGSFRDVDLRVYSDYIISSFNATGTPKSFSETSAKLGALVKNWLTQKSVSRSTVLLLGFGLKMSVNEVSQFLVNAQRERDFNFKDPFEVICRYCYENGFGFERMTSLYSQYEQIQQSERKSLENERTVGVRSVLSSAGNTQELLKLLSGYKLANSGWMHSVTVHRHFDELYQKCRQIIADCYNKDEQELVSRRIERYEARLARSSKLFDYEKRKLIAEMRTQSEKYSASDINESDVEKFLCCGTPIDKSGNLVKISSSALAEHFSNKRMSRQHIGKLLRGHTEPDRFDLITLNFFIYSQDETITNNKIRYMRFLDSTNEILEDCLMGELYIANPYECFLLMCSLSDCPLAAYADVIEKSYEAFPEE